MQNTFLGARDHFDDRGTIVADTSADLILYD
jgi:hypothetical protein